MFFSLCLSYKYKTCSRHFRVPPPYPTNTPNWGTLPYPEPTHRGHFCEDILASKVSADEGSRHRDNEVEDGDDQSLHWPHFGEEPGQETFRSASSTRPFYQLPPPSARLPSNSKPEQLRLKSWAMEWEGGPRLTHPSERLSQPDFPVPHLAFPGHWEFRHALDPWKKKKQRISEWKQPREYSWSVWAQPSLLPNTLVLSSPWILSRTSWSLLWDQAFQRRDVFFQSPCIPLFLWARCMPEKSRVLCQKNGSRHISTSTTFKNQSPSELTVSVNRMGTVSGLYTAQSFYSPLILVVYKPGFHTVSFICASSSCRALLSGATGSTHGRVGSYLTGDIAGDPLIFLIGQLYLNLFQTSN